MEAAKGVIWDHGVVKIKGKKAHKYLVGFVLLTDEPIPAAARGSDACHIGGGRDNEITRALQTLRRYMAPRRLGDIGDVLTSVGEWDPAEMERDNGGSS